MPSHTAAEFSWNNPLGIGTALFLSVGAVYMIIACAGMIILHRQGVAASEARGFFLGPKADSVWFGKPPNDVVRDNPQVGRMVLLFMDIITGFMLAFGIVTAGVAWFGLRSGNAWALWVLVAANAAMLATYWLLAMLPFMREYGFSYREVFHPYAAYPTVIIPIATVLAWIGLRQ